jgi:hypothetical protein
MKITLELTPDQVNAIARVIDVTTWPNNQRLNDDLLIKDDVLRRIVGQAGIVHGMRSPEVQNCIAKDYNAYCASKHGPVRPRRLPQSHHIGGPGRS